jgi:TPR repeat protein
MGEFVLVFLMAIALAGAALAGPLEDGVAAYDRGDYAIALRLLQPLANGGSSDAQYRLGAMYGTGQGVPQDYAESRKWYQLAADQGNADAQNNLGIMYVKGEGVPQDYIEAHKWFNLAVSRYPASEAKKRNTSVQNRDLVAAKMTPQQIAEAQKLARDWKPTRAARGTEASPARDRPPTERTKKPSLR